MLAPHTQAIMLLTTHFPKEDKDSAKPLSVKEWARFAKWLNDKEYRPDQLLGDDLDKILQAWNDKSISDGRIKALLDRGSLLALNIEKWTRAGLWVLVRSEPEYPKMLKKRLGHDSPPVLFGCGNKALLNATCLAVVGSRKTSGEDYDYSYNVGKAAAENGYTIVSGGAAGVDESAMSGALEIEGTAVGVLADSLLRRSTSAKYRKYLLSNGLVLVSTSNPEAGFNPGLAMQRNKYIYCLSGASLVVHSGLSGGTWTGAQENLKNQWAPLWIKRTGDNDSGNELLVKAGARWVSEDTFQIELERLFVSDSKPADSDLFHEMEMKPSARGPDAELVQESEPCDYSDYSSRPEADQEPAQATTERSFYQFFVEKLSSEKAEVEFTAADLAVDFKLTKSQINSLLKQAVKGEQVEKLSKPVRYRISNSGQRSLALE